MTFESNFQIFKEICLYLQSKLETGSVSLNIEPSIYIFNFKDLSDSIIFMEY